MRYNGTLQKHQYQMWKAGAGNVASGILTSYVNALVSENHSHDFGNKGSASPS